MRAQKLLMCRGSGKAYIQLLLQDLPDHARISVTAKTSTGHSVPAYWCNEEGSGAAGEQKGLLVIPLMETASVTADICAKGAEGQILDRLSYRVSRMNLAISSKYNYLMKREQCEALRVADERSARSIKTEALLCMPDRQECVWRIKARFLQMDREKHDVEFSCLDGRGKAHQAEPIFFEDQVIPVKGRTYFERLLTVSFRLPSSLTSYVIGVEVDDSLVKQGFFSVGPGECDAYIKDSLQRTKNASFGDDYRKWRHAHELSHPDRVIQSQRPFPYEPLVSIVVPCFEPHIPYLKAMIESVRVQSYPNWELVLADSRAHESGVEAVVESFSDPRIKRYGLRDNLGIVGNTNHGIEQAQGEFIAFLDYDDLIEPQALHEYLAAINDNPGLGALYCDEDVFEQVGNYKMPVFKSDFNRDLLYCHNYVTHFLMVKKSVLDEIGLCADEVNGAQDYDLILRVSETEHAIAHVPKVLYHWRMHTGSTSGDNAESKPYAHTAGQVALTRHFERRNIKALVEDGPIPYTYRVRYGLATPAPSVDIIIPSKDHIDVLDRCLRSILERATYENYRIFIVENNSTQAETFAYYEQIQKEYSRVELLEWKAAFNYSEVINFGAEQSSAEYLLFLNNDTELISPDFIEEMLGYLQRPEVGVVGAKLYFHDGLVQHAGMLIGPDDTVVHVNQNLPATHGGYLSRAERPGNFSSVTGACQMVKRTAFDEVGGYSPEFVVGFNDADFCCKLTAAGYLVVYTPYAELHHYEFVSRGREEGNEEEMERWRQERDLMKARWPRYFEEGDPFSNPNLDPNSTYFALPV